MILLPLSDRRHLVLDTYKDLSFYNIFRIKYKKTEEKISFEVGGFWCLDPSPQSKRFGGALVGLSPISEHSPVPILLVSIVPK